MQNNTNEINMDDIRMSPSDAFMRKQGTSQRHKKILGGGALFFLVILFILIASLSGSDDESTVNNLGLEQAFGTLRTISASSYVRLQVQMSEPALTGDAIDMELYVKSSTFSMDALEKVDMTLSYTTNGTQYNNTVLNQHGYYTTENAMGDTDTMCLEQESVPPVTEIITGLFELTPKDDEDDMSSSTETLLQALECSDNSDSMTMKAMYDGTSYYFCVVLDEVTEEFQITTVSAAGMLVKVSYLDETQVDAAVVSGLETFPSTLMSGEEYLCPKLDL